MLKFGHPKVASVQLLGILFVCAGLLAATAAIGGVRINTSYSLPLGIYVRTHNRDARLIEFCPVEPFASESSERGYRTRGTACDDGAVPLLKPIVAVAGDQVVLSAEGMRVNGHLLPKTAPLFRDAAGRSLHPWPFGTYVVEQGVVWVASTYNRGSYDSRYMGPIRISQIRARLRAVWLL
jgi:conjugative transfer signal peptidase TraF